MPSLPRTQGDVIHVLVWPVMCLTGLLSLMREKGSKKLGEAGEAKNRERLFSCLGT